MDVYNLGPVGWRESQTIYHALAVLGREALVICCPETPYVCLGLHDDLEQEIDQQFCKAHHIPLLRRETGGGVVYLDNQQIFYQLVLSRDNPILPFRRERYYQKFLKPAISVYRKIGIPAEIKPPADIVAHGLKCSGNAAGDIGKGVAFTGNILINFDFKVMSQILKVPDDLYRSCLYDAMRCNMTTITDWGSNSLGYSEIADLLIAEFTSLLGELQPCSLDEELITVAEKLGRKLTADKWLRMPGRKLTARKVKIAEGIFLLAHQLNTGGNVVVLIKQGIIDQLNIVKPEKKVVKLDSYTGIKWDESVLIELNKLDFIIRRKVSCG